MCCFNEGGAALLAYFFAGVVEGPYVVVKEVAYVFVAVNAQFDRVWFIVVYFAYITIFYKREYFQF